MMKCEALLQTLNAVKPAIGTQLVRQLAHLWFDNGTVTTFNDIIGLSAPCAVPLAAGVPAKVIEFLEASRELDDIVIKVDAKGGLTLRLGKAKLDIETLPLSDRIFEMPVPVEPFTMSQGLLDALRTAQLSMPEKFIGNDVVGITLVREGSELAAYATDAKSISWSRVPLPKKCMIEREVLSRPFVTEVLRHCQPGAFMEIAPDHALAVAESDVQIFGRLIAPPKQLDFAGVIGQAVGDAHNRAVPMPEGLKPALDRAAVELKWMPEPRPAKITVAKKELQISLGGFHEVVPLAEAHPSASRFFDIALIRRAMDEHQWILIDEHCVMLKGGVDAGYLLGSMADVR
jgi:hypothetical protein